MATTGYMSGTITVTDEHCNPTSSPKRPSGPDKVNHVRRVLRIWLGAVGDLHRARFVIVPLLNPTSASSTPPDSRTSPTSCSRCWRYRWRCSCGCSSSTACSSSAPASRRARPSTSWRTAPPLEAKPRHSGRVAGDHRRLGDLPGRLGNVRLLQADDRQPAANPLVVNVTGQQWTWTYAYPALGVQSNVLELPSGSPGGVPGHVRRRAARLRGQRPRGRDGREPGLVDDGADRHPDQARQLRDAVRRAVRPLPHLHVVTGEGRSSADLRRVGDGRNGGNPTGSARAQAADERDRARPEAPRAGVRQAPVAVPEHRLGAACWGWSAAVVVGDHRPRVSSTAHARR